MTFALLTILAAAPLAPPPMVEADVVTQPRPERLKYAGTVLAGYHLVEMPNWGAIGAGLGVFLGSYIPWAAIGTMLGKPENLVPVFGPIIAFEASTGWFADLANFFSIFFIGVDVLAQTAGLITLIVGLANPRYELQRNSGPSISFLPRAAGADFGASVVGRF